MFHKITEVLFCFFNNAHREGLIIIFHLFEHSLVEQVDTGSAEIGHGLQKDVLFRIEHAVFKPLHIQKESE